MLTKNQIAQMMIFFIFFVSFALCRIQTSTARIEFGLESQGPYQVQQSTGQTTSESTLSVARQLNVAIDYLTFRIDSLSLPTATWQSELAAAAQRNLKLVFIVSFAARNPSSESGYLNLLTQLAQFVRPLTASQIWIVLEPELNVVASIGSLRTTMELSVAQLRRDLTSRSDVLVGLGMTLRNVPFQAFVSAFDAQKSGVLSLSAGFDFVAVLVDLRVSDGVALLRELPCRVHILTRWIAAEFDVQTIVPVASIEDTALDIEWQSALIKVYNDLRAQAPLMYLDGLRMFGAAQLLCTTNQNGACAARTRLLPQSNIFVSDSLALKTPAQQLNTWQLNEQTLNRRDNVPSTRPAFLCSALLPIKSGSIYDDALLSWQNSQFGWSLDTFGAADIQLYSTELKRDGEFAMRVSLPSAGASMQFRYSAAWPLTPFVGSEVQHVVFDYYRAAELVHVNVAFGVNAPVSLDNYVLRGFEVRTWQRVAIPIADLVPASARGNTLGPLSFRASASNAVFFIDRLSLNTPALPCDLTQPETPCGTIYIAPSGPTPAPVARCGNFIVEANEDCDGGDCCLADCTLKPRGTACRAANTADQCDVADVCDGVSGGCRDAKKPTNTPCDDGDDACTENDRCRFNGACAGDFKCQCTSDAQCETDFSRCTQDTCLPNGTCQSTPTLGGFPCNDNDPCTSTDVCDGAGQCAGSPVLCRKPPPPAAAPTQSMPANCKPGTQHLCRCQLPQDYCIPPLECRQGICYGPPSPAPTPSPVAEPCAFADWGKKSGCFCVAGNCDAPLECDAELELCIGDDETSQSESSIDVSPAAEDSAAESLVWTLGVPIAFLLNFFLTL